MKRKTREKITGYLFVLPAGVILGVFLLIPIGWAWVLSFTSYSPLEVTFVGVNNYKDIISDSLFLKSLINTLVFVTGIMMGGVTLSLVLALLIRKITKFAHLFKSAYFLPIVIPWVAASLIWKWMYHPSYSIINYYFGLIGVPPVPWLGSVKFSMFSIVLVSIWKGAGYNMLIFLAGLGSIPRELYEASMIDGANKWRQFWFVTIPLLKPVTLFVIVVTTIDGLQVFIQPYLMTEGGPAYSTLTVVLYLYRLAFRFFRMGYGSAVAIILFFITMVFSLIQLKLLGVREKSLY